MYEQKNSRVLKLDAAEGKGLEGKNIQRAVWHLERVLINAQSALSRISCPGSRADFDAGI
jgi:hypothetical protein